MNVPRRSFRAACVFLLAVLAAHPAFAAGGDVVAKVTALNRKGLDEYAKQKYEAARASLKQALEMCNAAGLDKHPIKARTHIHLGMIAIGGFNQRDLAIKHFRKALEIQPEIKLTQSIATQEMEEAFAEAASAGGQAPTAGNEGGAGTPEGGEAAVDEEGGGARPSRKKAVKRADDEGSGDEEEEAPGAYRFYIAINVGSGIGIASGKGELNPAHELKAAGFAPAQLGHISPEVGYFVSPKLLLSARLRLQYVSGLTGQMSANGCGADRYCDPVTFGVAGFARGTYFLGAGSFRPFVAAEIGGGNIRHAQVFPGDPTCGKMGNTQCVDTLASGPFLAGAAFGFLYDFGSTVGAVVTVAADIGVPKFTLNFDVTAGLALHF